MCRVLGAPFKGRERLYREFIGLRVPLSSACRKSESLGPVARVGFEVYSFEGIQVHSLEA